jgi:hypothetical protein
MEFVPYPADPTHDNYHRAACIPQKLKLLGNTAQFPNRQIEPQHTTARQ